jgi:hypothetical protein
MTAKVGAAASDSQVAAPARVHLGWESTNPLTTPRDS